jgi:hypothetical protein
MRMKLALLGIVLVAVGFGFNAAFRTGRDVHWDLRTSHLDKDIEWPADNATDMCVYERGAIHTAVIDLPGLPQIRTTPLLFVDCRRNGSAVCELVLCQTAVTRDEVIAQAHAFERLFGWSEESFDWWIKEENTGVGNGGLFEVQRKDWFRNERPLEISGTIVHNYGARSDAIYSLMITIWWRNDDPMNAGERDPRQAHAGLRALETLARQHPQTTKPATMPSVPPGTSPKCPSDGARQ